MYAVLFDIDGTLLQTGGAGHVAFTQTFAEVFQITDLPTGVTFAGRSDRGIASELMELCGIEVSEENWQRFVEDYCGRLEQVLEDCEGRVLPGVESLLDALEQDEHVAVGLLTGNMDFGAQAKTAAYGMHGRFAFGGYGDLRTNRDHIAADALVAAQEWVDENNPNEPLCGTMVIGDTPADVRCGRAIDAFVVAVATGGASYDELAKCQPDLLLKDLSDGAGVLVEVARARQLAADK